jgi:hypothetical protein
MPRSAARAERQPGENAGRAVVGGHDEAPPRVGVVLARHRQDADARLALGHGVDHLADRAEGGQRRIAAEMVAGDVPIAARLRRVNGDGEAGLQPDRRRQHLAPHPDQRGAREIAAMAIHQPAQDHRLAARPQRGDLAGDLLPPDRRDDLGPLHQEIVELIVDLVDAPAEIVEERLTVGHVRVH